MARPAYGGRILQINDARRWHREGRLSPGQYFPWSWTCGGQPSGNIGVRTDSDAVVLMHRSRSYGDAEWRSIEQRVPIVLDGMSLWRSPALFHMCGLFRRSLIAALVNYSHAGAATGWHMRASRKRCTAVGWGRHRRSECG
jgi:hypothetical protein